METQRATRFERVKLQTITLVGMGVFALGAYGVSEGKEYFDPEDVYIDTFTGEGHCLNDSPYDPESGALIHTDVIDGVKTLSVVPNAANSYDPSVLFFTSELSGLDRPTLQFADHDTGALVTNHGCPDQPDGY